MSLSKQLYIIISFIFLMIFTGDFIISVNNTKAYLQTEAATKAQDTATSLGMTLKSLMDNKKDPEIESIIKAISNRGFYKEIRLEDVELIFNNNDLIMATTDLDPILDWEISHVMVESDYGVLEENTDDELSNELEALENDKDTFSDTQTTNNHEKIYKFLPTNKYLDGGIIPITFTATYKNQSSTKYVELDLSKVLVKEMRQERFDYIPQWFINALPLQMEEKKSEINSGWNTTAIVYVSANAGDAYAKLYNHAKTAITYAAIAFAFSILLLIVFLQFILKPLKNIEKLAMNISKGQFSIIKKLPYTTEVRNVAIAMNEMSTKIESIIKKLNVNIENVTQKISLDDLTNLHLRQTFETDMKKMFIAKNTGYVFIVKINELAQIAKNNSNQEVDTFIKDFANILKNTHDNFEFDISAYRFFGSEFAMILKNANNEQTQQVAQYLKQKFEKLGEKLNIKHVANIGATPFNPIGTTPEMISASLEAFEMARQIGPNEAYIRDESDLARDMLVWKDLIFDIIDNAKFTVGYIGDAKVLCGDAKDTLVMQEAFTQAQDYNAEQIPIGTFVSIAEKYEKVIDFDKAVVNKVVKHIIANGIEHDISINLSLDSICSEDFISWVHNYIAANKVIAPQLVFSVTGYAVAKDINKFKHFSQCIHESGAKVIIKRFESKFISLESIKDLNIDYIRLARDYTQNIYKDTGKQAFVEAMQELCNLLNIKLFAENVKEDEDFNKVLEIELYAASR
jgi:EAL domain-containing protein (putative c-di-GMP-specific phosphodiesterase class I)/GGDEF domain-containing protein